MYALFLSVFSNSSYLIFATTATLTESVHYLKQNPAVLLSIVNCSYLPIKTFLFMLRSHWFLHML